MGNIKEEAETENITRSHPKKVIENGVLHRPRHIQREITHEIEKLEKKGLIIKMKWQEGDFAINDNLGLAHYACPGTQRPKGEIGLRVLHRTTIVGSDKTVPQKVDGRRSFFI